MLGGRAIGAGEARPRRRHAYIRQEAVGGAWRVAVGVVIDRAASRSRRRPTRRADRSRKVGEVWQGGVADAEVAIVGELDQILAAKDAVVRIARAVGNFLESVFGAEVVVSVGSGISQPEKGKEIGGSRPGHFVAPVFDEEAGIGCRGDAGNVLERRHGQVSFARRIRSRDAAGIARDIDIEQAAHIVDVVSEAADDEPVIVRSAVGEISGVECLAGRDADPIHQDPVGNRAGAEISSHKQLGRIPAGGADRASINRGGGGLGGGRSRNQFRDRGLIVRRGVQKHARCRPALLDQVIKNRATRCRKAGLARHRRYCGIRLHDGNAIDNDFRGPRPHFIFQIGDDRLGSAVGEDLGLLAAGCATDQHGLASAATEKCDDDKAHQNQHRKCDDQCRAGVVAGDTVFVVGVSFHREFHLTVYMRS